MNTNIDDTFNAPTAPAPVKPTKEDVLASLKWGPRTEVNTKLGPRITRKAPSTPALRELWIEQKDVLKAEGYSLGEWPVGSGKWSITKWEKLPDQIVVQRAEAKALSRATDATINAPCPDGLAYLGYQRAGIAFGFERPAVLIGDEMGLGKTIQAIGILNCMPEARRILVICPASLKLNWRREIERWQTVKRTVMVVDSTQKDFFKSLLRTLFLDDQKRPDAAQQSNNIGAASNLPSKLILGGANESGIASSGRSVARIAQPTESKQPVDQLPIRAVDHDTPSDLSAKPGNASLSVDDAGQVSALRDGARKNKRLGLSPAAKKAGMPSGAQVIVESIDMDAQLSSDSEGTFTGHNAASDHRDGVFGQSKSNGHIFIVNYDILHVLQDELHSIEFDLLICDEAHYLKGGNETRRGKMVLGIKATAKQRQQGVPDVPGIRAKKRLFLTGTPISNRPKELFPLISYLDPERWPNFFKFGIRYCNGNQSSGYWDFSGASNLGELQDILRSTIMVRRLKKDVLTELPPKRRQVIELPATGEMRRALETEREAYAAHEDRLESLQTAVELAKASDNPDDYRRAVDALSKGMGAAFGEIATIRRETAVSKIPVVIEHLEEAIEESGKVICFCHHKECVARIAEHFGSSAVQLVGDTAMQDRQDAVDRFQKDPDCKLFIGSIMAAGVGITLTASSHVVMAELDWVPGNVSQAEDRAHRIGQRESVLIQHLVLEDSLDAIMARRIIAKQEVIDKALDKEPPPPEAFSTRKGGQHATASTKAQDLAAEAEKMTTDQRAAAHEAVRRLAAVCDGARDRDDSGFNGLDTAIGHELAAQSRLSPKQAALARKICLKYHGQLGDALTARLKGDLL